MLDAMKNWTWVRVVLVLAGVFGAGTFLPGPTSPFAGGSLMLLVQLFLFGVIGMLFVVGIQAVNPRSDATWQRPAWNLNPFNLKQPLQLFHLAAFHFIAAGIAAVVLAQVRRIVGLEPFVPLAIGGGCLTGVWLCVLIFRRKFTLSGRGDR